MWFCWGFEPLCCQYDFSTIGRHYQNNPIDEQGLDVDYIKTRFVKGQLLCLYLC
jgi:GntR family transcriptional regulator/MocR family aminotransferase